MIQQFVRSQKDAQKHEEQEFQMSAPCSILQNAFFMRVPEKQRTTATQQSSKEDASHMLVQQN